MKHSWMYLSCSLVALLFALSPLCSQTIDEDVPYRDLRSPFNTSNAADDVYWSGVIPDSLRPTFGGVSAIVQSGTRIYVGGQFSRIGGIDANNIAYYDTETEEWVSLGTGESNGVGLPTNSSVRAMVVHDGKIYVGGTFAEVGGNDAGSIAMWDEVTESWSTMNGGVRGGTFSGSVRDLVVDGNGDLYAGGQFATAGGLLANNIARWDGVRWHVVGGGVSGQFFAEVRALEFIDDDLYVGGRFETAGGSQPANSLARWDGTSWTNLGQELLSFARINDLKAGPGGELYVGGLSLFTGNDNSLVPLGVFENGQWSTPGDFTDRGTDQSGWVSAIEVDEEGLITIVGKFRRIDDLFVNGIAQLGSDQIWKALSDGLYHFGEALLSTESGLLVGGSFVRAGNAQVRGLALWDGSQWSSIGKGIEGGRFGWITTILVVDESEIYVAGNFNGAGGESMSNVGLWDGDQWHSLGDGFDGIVSTLAVNPEGVLYAGGRFREVLARWSGTEWRPHFNEHWDDVAVIKFFGPTLYAAGGARDNGEDSRLLASSIGRFHGDYWEEIGIFNGDEIIPGIFGPATISDFVVTNDSIFVGGSFTSMQNGSTEALNIACWDGREWSSLGGGAQGGTVSSLALMGNDLMVGGSFTNVGGKIVSGVAKWDRNNQVWDGVGNGVANTLNTTNVLSMVVVGTELIATGSFDVSGVTDVSNIATWDGRDWFPMGSGVSGSASELAIDSAGNLYVAGSEMTRAGEESVGGVARWSKFPVDVAESSERTSVHSILLAQNPVSDRARFLIELAHADDVKLDLYTTSGAFVGNVADGSYTAGQHAVEWVTSEIESGTYIYQLTTTDGVAAGKITVVR